MPDNDFLVPDNYLKPRRKLTPMGSIEQIWAFVLLPSPENDQYMFEILSMFPINLKRLTHSI